MSAFLSIIAFELRYYLGKISTWVYFGIYAGLGFLFVQLLGGAFEGAQASIGGSDGHVVVNSPYVIAALLSNISLYGVLITAALAGHAGYRDFGEGIHPLFFTTPVSKWSFLGGRYVGTVIINVGVLSGGAVGLLVGSYMPWLEAEQFGPTLLSAYAMPLLILVYPNILFFSAIFLSLAALTRARLPHYIGGVCLVMGYILASILTSDLEAKWVAAMIDPFGLYAFEYVTEYWTTVEKNTMNIGLSGWILANRALWISISLGIFAAGASLFRFQHEAWTLPFFREKRVAVDDSEAAPAITGHRITLPPVTRSFDAGVRWAQFLAITRRTFADLIRNAYFLAILLFGVLFLVVSATQVGEIYDTPTMPVTYQVVEMLGGTFGLFVVIILTFYAGELVWHERDLKVQQLVDTTPIPNWIPYLAKFTALATVLAVLQSVVLVTGVLTQAFQGYFHFELGLYVQALWGFQLVDYLLLAVLALAVHSVVNHKYMGHVIVIGFYASRLFMGQLGLEHTLYRFGSDLGSPYSDMNGFGPFVWPFLWYKLYWGCFAMLLALLSNVAWVRGQESSVTVRARVARGRWNRTLSGTAAVFALGTVLSGGYIFYNTNVRNDYRTSYDGELRAAAWERTYKKYEGAPQPRIVGVKIDVDLYPEQGEARSKGTYRLVNKTDAPLSEVHVQMPGKPDVIDRFAFDRPTETVLEDEEYGFRIYRLLTPLQPGEEMALDWDFFYANTGFENDGVSTSVVDNGTFVSSPSVAPRFGYDPDRELGSDRNRRQHGFEPKERMADLDDTSAYGNTYIAADADWVDFETVVSTSPDQIAIAPGYLQKEWTEDGRRYFHYKMDAPILNFYSFLSARYVVKKGQWRDVPIEVYYHPGHEWNVDRMIDAVGKSLDYYTDQFSPYQHKQVRILEFPRYASFAQSFPNTIPYSESIGFIARVGEDDVDYPFYVTAHEVAHQWWAHQVIGANVQGSTLMSETMSQYSALMVMEREFGPEKIRKFLSYELDNYLSGRGGERKKELPLLRVENQQYIHYNKGALAMYLLKDHIGEQALNGALAKYIEAVAFQEPPYTTSREFLSYLREATPPDRQYLLEDLFEKITLYENKATGATAKKAGTGWDVTVQFEARKVYAGEQGEEIEVTLADWIDIGVFGADDAVLYLEKHKIEAGMTEITVHVDGQPEQAGIDPWTKLIDRHPDDNTTEVTIDGV